VDPCHVWFSLKEGVKDVEFSDGARTYFEHLKEQRRLATYRITRRKLGHGHPSLQDWHVMLEFEVVAQLGAAFEQYGHARAL